MTERQDAASAPTSEVVLAAVHDITTDDGPAFADLTPTEQQRVSEPTRRILNALRSLPVEQRMEAMAMRFYGEVTWDDEEERDVVTDPVDVMPGASLWVDEAWVDG